MYDDILIQDYTCKNLNANQSDTILMNHLTKYKEENKKLQYQLNLQQAKESLHKTTMEKVKTIQEDYDKAYELLFKDSKERENKMKEQYEQYSLRLQSAYNQKEYNYISKIEELNKEVSIKNEQIQTLQDNIKDIIDKNSINEINFKLKQKDYEEVIQSKEKRLIELEKSVKTISEEANERIDQLSEQLNKFNSRIKESTITIESEHHYDTIESKEDINDIKKDTIQTLNEQNNSPYSLKSTIEQQQQLQQQQNEDCGKACKCNEMIKKLQVENELLLKDKRKLYFENIIKGKTIHKEVKKEFELSNHYKKIEQLNTMCIKQLKEQENKDNTFRDEYKNNINIDREIEGYDILNKALRSHRCNRNLKMNLNYKDIPTIHTDCSDNNNKITVSNDAKTNTITSRNVLKQSKVVDSFFFDNKKSATLMNKSSHLLETHSSITKLSSKLKNLKKMIRKSSVKSHTH